MDRIHRDDLQQLLEPRTGPCVSLFMPMHLTGRDGMEDPVRLRKLVDEAEHALTTGGLRPAQSRELLAPIRALPEDNAAWQQRGWAVAFFGAPGFHRLIHTRGHLEPSVHVNQRFNVVPLIPLVTDQERFFLLSLSQNAVRLYEGDSAELREQAVPEAPASLADALKIEDVDRGEQVHSAMRGSLGKQAGVFHGQGGKPEAIKDGMREFVGRIATAIDCRLNGEHAPLVLATVEATVPLWRAASRYKFLLGDFVAGNADHVPLAELHAKAWKLVEPALAGHRKWCEQRLMEAEGAKVASSLRDIVPAAIAGRVSALFIDCHSRRWGKYDAANHEVVLHAEREAGDEDLVELAAVETMRHGGDVFDLQREKARVGESAEALLRF